MKWTKKILAEKKFCSVPYCSLGLFYSYTIINLKHTYYCGLCLQFACVIFESDVPVYYSCLDIMVVKKICLDLSAQKYIIICKFKCTMYHYKHKLNYLPMATYCIKVLSIG